jgi:hypothetical protein
VLRTDRAVTSEMRGNDARQNSRDFGELELIPLSPIQESI